jgi:hypothetical protein
MKGQKATIKGFPAVEGVWDDVFPEARPHTGFSCNPEGRMRPVRRPSNLNPRSFGSFGASRSRRGAPEAIQRLASLGAPAAWTGAPSSGDAVRETQPRPVSPIFLFETNTGGDHA